MSEYAVRNPATGELVRSYDVATDAEVQDAIHRAHEAYTSWGETIRVVGDQWYFDSYVHSGPAEKALIDRERLHPLGRWYHVAAVYDGTEFSNYVDGIQEGRERIHVSPQQAGRASVGVRINLVNYFKGAIRLARFTSRALTPREFLSVR